MIPLRDSIPSRTFPAVTIALIVANVAVFLWQLSLGPGNESLVLEMGAVPARFTRGAPAAAQALPAPATLLTSMFLHGGLFHLAGNMVFLWIFGNNVEDAVGHVRFVVFYALCGVAAASGHILFHPDSRIPMVGASGAISGVLGAYFLLYPQARIRTLVFLGFLAQVVNVPAYIFLGVWFLMQFVTGAATEASSAGGGVAWMAHVAGFVAGVPLLLVFRRRGVRLWSRDSR